MGSSSERSCSSPSAAASSHCHISVAQLDNTLGSLRDLFDGFAGDRNSSISTLMRTSVRGQTNLWCSAILRSEEHTSELQSLMRISYAVFCLKKKKNKKIIRTKDHKEKYRKVDAKNMLITIYH